MHAVQSLKQKGQADVDLGKLQPWVKSSLVLWIGNVPDPATNF